MAGGPGHSTLRPNFRRPSLRSECRGRRLCTGPTDVARIWVDSRTDSFTLDAVKAYKAIAAMSENRVIGANGAIPWHLPEDFKWFKRVTLGHRLVMGRKTYESIGRPLPGRETIVLSRHGFAAPGVVTIPNVPALDAYLGKDPREVFVAGGAEIYALLLPRCSDLYLTRVKRTVSGDAFFPPFEQDFVHVGNVMETDEFVVEHYQHRSRMLA